MAGILQNPNWLLRGFILVSIGIHLVIVLHLTGIYQSRAVSYIELSMQALFMKALFLPRPRNTLTCST
ncbi:MAG: hypothetical protein HUK40_09855 [Desulfobacter sp.]|nr:hypothetical protein [Desulfobacter sp.]WDP84375.1 MAG: hypothetical protein HUN05_03770 [Desulfobacter sp.]